MAATIDIRGWHRYIPHQFQYSAELPRWTVFQLSGFFFDVFTRRSAGGWFAFIEPFLFLPHRGVPLLGCYALRLRSIAQFT